MRPGTRLVDEDAYDDRPGGPAADRPARRRIDLLARGAAVRSGGRPAGADRNALVEAARWLADRPTFTGTATELLVALGRLDNLDEIADTVTCRPGLAVGVADLVDARRQALRDRLDPTVLIATVGRSAGRGDLAGGLLAVALVRHGAGFGWPGPWRDLLLDLRRHPDLDVREQAFGIDMS
ncbi:MULTISPECIES: hypothetical protein [Micromonospora]|uniref:HEAT repeat-containing protein n=1 Tax=Micromonospora yangpuensis TaxID=683228 RepID=A0A1C6UM23_9ACTN|nr:hypothetical protein [Micromonospora yangpuensis]GGM18192.1 hypothetical protein GCM10012279_40520 [Micromonospora yangpuensis]SCL55038.1 hypothetical protein GA0070617_2841 [Micromonospora yangpuensis]